jgi:hypothetical protein
MVQLIAMLYEARALYVTHNLNNFRRAGENPKRDYNQDSQLPILNARSVISN